MKAIICAVALLGFAGAAAGQCCGDCDADGSIPINELVTAVNNALHGACPLDRPTCCGDCGRDGAVEINELVIVVNAALGGQCRADSTPTPHPNPSPTPGPGCPFRFDQDTGGAWCEYVGDWIGRDNEFCGWDGLSMAWTSDGRTVAFEVDTAPPLRFFATATSETVAPTRFFQDGLDPTQYGLQDATLRLYDSGRSVALHSWIVEFHVEGCCPHTRGRCSSIGAWEYVASHRYVGVSR